MERQRGTVKWFSREKGWGFIRLDNGEEIFVHHSDIQGEGFVSLEDDQPVEFVIEQMEKGPRARQVREVGAAAPHEADAKASHDVASGTESGGDGSSDRRERPPLAEQLRRRLGSLFPGLDG